MRCDNFLLWLLLVLPAVLLFGPVFWRGDVLAYRDAGNFYYPLFHWQCEQWSTGDWPLWDPYSGLGVPAYADATSSTFYPGKLVFALPVNFALRYNLFLVLHVVLAAAAVYWSLRRWSSGRCAAALGAVSYGCSGPVLFQYSNVSFLVGAAWFPLAITLADQFLTKRVPRDALACGVVLAIMVVGGDPQLAYHVMLLAGCRALQMWWQERRVAAEPPCPALPHRTSNKRMGRPLLLGVAVLTGLGLSAVQTLPSWQWTQRSDRAAFDDPRNIWESVTLGSDPDFEGDVEANETRNETHWASIRRGLLQRNTEESYDAHRYDYSVAPWRVVELGWPNVTGTTFPRNLRWLSAFGEGSSWTPSLYCGLLPLLLAISARRKIRQDGRAAAGFMYLGWGALASLGGFGAGWVVQLICQLLGINAAAIESLHPAVGGLYWFCVVLLPGYAYFRYPAKWLIVAVWGLSLYAARGLDAVPDQPRPLQRWCLAAGTISLFFAGLAIVLRLPLENLVQAAPRHPIFGPLDVAAAWEGLMVAFLHAAVISVTGLLLLRFVAPRWKALAVGGLLVTTIIDLAVAQRPLIGAVTRQALAVAPGVAQADEPLQEQQPPLRITGRGGRLPLPRSWRDTTDPQRLETFVTWQTAVARHKLHLLYPIGSPESLGTCNTQAFRSWLNLLADARRQNQQWRVASLLGAVNVRHLQMAPAQDGDQPARWSTLTLNPATVLPRAWIVHRIERGAALGTRSRESWDRALAGCWLTEDGQQLRDPREVVTIWGELPAVATQEEVSNDESCEIAEYTPQRIVVDAVVRSPGMLVISDAYDADWQAIRHGQEDTGSTECHVYRVNGVLRAVFLPAGRHRVEFQYRPRQLFAGAVISVLCVLALIGLWVRTSPGFAWKKRSASQGRVRADVRQPASGIRCLAGG